MFHEFENFKLNPWNAITLTNREHFIAHWLLWKSFPTTRSMTFAFFSMINQNRSKINGRTYSRLRSAQADLVSKMNSGRVNLNQSKMMIERNPMNSSQIRKEHSRRFSGEGNPNFGKHHTKDTKQKMSAVTSDGRRKGANNQNADHTIYNFINIKTNDRFTGTRIQFTSTHSDVSSSVLNDNIIRNRYTSRSGWRLDV